MATLPKSSQAKEKAQNQLTKMHLSSTTTKEKEAQNDIVTV
jgi:hypothetical protein